MKMNIAIGVLLILVVYLGLLTYLYVNQRTMMYFPDTNKPYPPSKDIELVSVTTQDKLEIQGWYWPPRDNTKPVLVYFHGNASNIGNRTGRIADYIANGYGILLTEYRGYGGNPGIPSEQGFYADARAYLYWLANAKMIPLNRIVIYGESIGTGVAVQMATEFKARALVLQGAYNSMAGIIGKHYPYVPPFLLLDKFDSAKKIGTVHMPILIVSAGRDVVIPGRLSEKLFEKANEPKVYKVLPEATHENMTEHGLSAAVLEFLNAIDFSGNNATY